MSRGGAVGTRGEPQESGAGRERRGVDGREVRVARRGNKEERCGCTGGCRVVAGGWVEKCSAPHTRETQQGALGHRGHLGVKPLLRMQLDALVHKGAADHHVGLHLGELVLHRLQR